MYNRVLLINRSLIVGHTVGYDFRDKYAAKRLKIVDHYAYIWPVKRIFRIRTKQFHKLFLTLTAYQLIVIKGFNSFTMWHQRHVGLNFPDNAPLHCKVTCFSSGHFETNFDT
jgi:hypothetical protein